MSTRTYVTTDLSRFWKAVDPPVYPIMPEFSRATGNKVLQSGRGLVWLSDLGNSLSDRSIDMDLWYKLGWRNYRLDETIATTITGGPWTAGSSQVKYSTGYSQTQVGDRIKFAGHSSEYIITGLPGSNNVNLTPNLTADVATSEGATVYHCTQDLGPALFDITTSGSERCLYIGASRNKLRLFVLVGSPFTIYEAKYNESGNIRTVAHWTPNDASQDVAFQFELHLRQNRYLQLYQKGVLLSFTADSMGTPITTVDIQNIRYGAGNTSYTPSGSGFAVGYGSAFYNTLYNPGTDYGDRHSFIDELRKAQF